MVFNRKTKEMYIIPNGYIGFIGVLYQDSKLIKSFYKDGYRLYIIPNSGVFESGFMFPKGEFCQKFLYENGEEIDYVGFVQFDRLDMGLHRVKYNYINRNKHKKFAIYYYGGTSNDMDKENCYMVYLIDYGKNIIKYLPKNESIYNYLMHDYSLKREINKESLEFDILNLNNKYIENNYPFD